MAAQRVRGEVEVDALEELGELILRGFKSEKGTRQGCPLSPLLFFISKNDILNEREHLGAWIPGIDQRVAGSQFADDMALMTENLANIQIVCDKLDEWLCK